ncbi:MAG: OmpA family protein [Candidatus Rokuibacteriota bacterium]
MAEIKKHLAIGVAGLAALVGVALAGSWMYTEMLEASARSAEAPAAVAVMAPAPASVKANVVAKPEVVHADIYFDFKSARLRADSVGVLQEQAGGLATGGTWAILVQGYADQQGPSEYNRRLAQRRADEVKRFLVELGVSEPWIKVVTIGQDGSLCDDPSAECQQLNRRVHLEMRKLSRTTAAVPSAMPPVSDSPVPVTDR